MLRRGLFSVTKALAKRSASTTTSILRGFQSPARSSITPITSRDHKGDTTKEIKFGEDIANCGVILASRHESRNARDQSEELRKRCKKLIAAVLGTKNFRLEQDLLGLEKIVFHKIPKNELEATCLKYGSDLSSIGLLGRLYINPANGEPRIELDHSRQELLEILSSLFFESPDASARSDTQNNVNLSPSRRP